MNKSRNMKSGAGYMLRREDYKRVKKMDRQQFENFCKNLYQTAYEEGRRSVPGIDITEVQKAISETPGIGAKRLEAIMESLNSRFAKERCVMKRTERTVNVKAWGRLGAKRVVLYEDRDELRFTDGFHDMRMTQARMEAFVPGGDAVLADVYRRVRGTRSWHPVVKELKKLLDERGGEAYED